MVAGAHHASQAAAAWGAAESPYHAHAHARGNCLPRTPLYPSAFRTPARGSAGRRRLHVRAVGWDPEGVLGPPVPGHIQRRKFQKQMAADDQQRERERMQQEREAARRLQARMERAIPEGDEALVEYLLRIEKDFDEQELQWEVARCGARLTDAFFSSLRSTMGTIRFAVRQSEADLQRLAQLEKLEKELLAQAETQEAMRQSIVSAKDRLHSLLSAPDKKQKILAMAAAGELDLSLLALLDENIVAAQQADQKSAVEFMEKVRGAIVKYMPKEKVTT